MMRLLVLVPLVAALAACRQTPPVIGGPASATIPPSGDSLEAFDAAGARYRLTFPAGALDRPTTVTLRPLPSDGRSLGAFEVEPAGLVTAVAVALEVVLPSGATPTAFASFVLGPGDVPVYVPTVVQGRTLSADLRFFAVPQDGSGIRTASGVPLPANEVTTSQGAGDPVAIAKAGCAERLASMRASFDALLASNAFEAAVALAFTAAGHGVLCDLEEEAIDWLDQASDAACTRYDELVLMADAFAVDTYDRLTELIQPVMNWQSTLNRLGIECTGIKTAVALIGEKYPQFLTFYASTVAGLTFTADYERLRDEARKVATLRGQATHLALPDAETMLERQVLFPIMALLRARSFDACVDTDDHYFLSTLIEVMFRNARIPIGSVAPLQTIAAFADADIRADIQYCASTLALEVWADPDVPEELAGARRELGPGAAPGQQTVVAETAGPVEGHLILRGPIEQLRCGQDRSLEAHELVVRFAGNEVHRATHLDGSIEVAIESALTAAGRDPTGLNEVDVEVIREGGTCGGLYGGPTTTLFTVTYSADPVPRATALHATPATVTAEQPVEFTFTLPWVDAGANLATLHMSYDLAGAIQTEAIDLRSSDAVAGFEAAAGTGTYLQTLTVFCDQVGKSTITVTAVLEDAYGQRSEERSTNVGVTYDPCPAAGTGSADADDRRGLVLGGAR